MTVAGTCMSGQERLSWIDCADDVESGGFGNPTDATWEAASSAAAAAASPASFHSALSKSVLQLSAKVHDHTIHALSR